MSPVGYLVFNTSEAPLVCLVGSTPTSSAKTCITVKCFVILNPRKYLLVHSLKPISLIS